jgi:hypothetical protein
MTAGRSALLLAMILGLASCAGCSPDRTRIELSTYDQAGQAEQHFSEFSRASFRQGAGGLIEVVMRSDRPSTLDPTQTITQILYIKSFWNPVPGTTYVEASQINSRIQYAMLTPPTGVRYDGGAFLTYHYDRASGDLIAKIESATLAPKYRLGDAVEPFGSSRLTGTIRAQENPRDVVSAAQLLETTFSEHTPASSATR